jgi:hypothetical protein
MLSRRAETPLRDILHHIDLASGFVAVVQELTNLDPGGRPPAPA